MQMIPQGFITKFHIQCIDWFALRYIFFENFVLYLSIQDFSILGMDTSVWIIIIGPNGYWTKWQLG